MSDDPSGPVHYQISVTGRQAAAFFLTLLGALGLAFFFGMKTGQVATRAPEGASRIAAMSDLPVPTNPPRASPGDGKQLPPPTPEAVEKKLGFDDGPPKEAATPAPVKSRATPTAVPSPLPSPRPTAPPKAARKEAKKETGPFFVQILATKEAETADQMARKLKGAGGFVNPDVSTVPGRPGLFRVRIGPYGERPLAEAALRRLKSEKWKVEPSIVRAEKP